MGLLPSQVFALDFLLFKYEIFVSVRLMHDFCYDDEVAMEE